MGLQVAQYCDPQEMDQRNRWWCDAHKAEQKRESQASDRHDHV